MIAFQNHPKGHGAIDLLERTIAGLHAENARLKFEVVRLRRLLGLPDGEFAATASVHAGEVSRADGDARPYSLARRPDEIPAGSDLERPSVP